MKKDIDYVKLVERAQLGDRQGLERLAELAEERLREDVGRITLNPDLTQDIVQETLLEMVKKLNELKTADRFWKWLTRIAFNKINHHYRKDKRYKTALTFSERDTEESQQGQKVVADLVSKEFQQIVRTAMQRLQPRQRTVLTLRCYRDMAYSDIAEVMGCSEFAAMMLFHRAKKSLGRQLARHGYGKGLLLPALVLFGKLTASSEAAAAQISVCAAVTEGGLLVGLAGLATSKIAIVSLGAAGALAVGMVVSTLTPETPGVGSAQESVPSVLSTDSGTQTSTRSGEYWHYFPEGPSGPMMMRVTSEADGPQSEFQCLQNDRANYTAHDHTIHINNQRMFADDLTVLQLPTDSAKLAGFISRVQGHGEAMDYVPGRGRNLLIVARYDSQQGTHHAQVANHSNVLDERYFLPDWPAGVKMVDNRDAMHKRGWTYFRVTGRIAGQSISGVGRLPFVYATSKSFSPWLKLKMADGSKIVDNGTGACVYDPSGKIIVRYKAGSFFKGLARPWMGLHTIDVVRRDAAEQEVWFETKPVPGREQVEVTLDCKPVILVYTINIETDVVETITFSARDGSEGELRFSYLQDIDDAGNEFDQPRIGRNHSARQDSPGMLWLVKLIKNSG
jgi:RNA polymerase sigma factor (sigma-70 family)